LEAGEIDRILAAVYGNYAWAVKQGHGSFLTVEFGMPSLQIREPMDVPPQASMQSRSGLQRRRVNVVGKWHLWIHCCNWSISFMGGEAAHSESSREAIASATEQLDGQRLSSVRRHSAQGTWTFTFDLGGELTTWPYGDDPLEEQWLFYEGQSGRVLTVRADDCYSYGPGNQRPDDIVWSAIKS